MKGNYSNLSNIDHFLLDLDGTTYIGETLLPGVKVFIDHLVKTNRTYQFITNNSSLSSMDYQQKLNRLGISCRAGQVVTSGDATISYLIENNLRNVFLLGTPELEADFNQAGLHLLKINEPSPDAVVLGFDKTITYPKILWASRLFQNGVPFIATHPDKVCPTPEGPIPDCGAMIALFKEACNVTPTTIGKPNPAMVHQALKLPNQSPKNSAIVGDRIYTDIVMGTQAKIFTILVLTGETTDTMVRKSDIQPSLIVQQLDELIPLL